MSTTSTTGWKYLERKPGSAYQQLFVKGTRIMARILYGMAVRDDEPLSQAEIAEAFDLPEHAVAEAVAYCKTDPPEIRDDWEREEAKVKARGLADPNFFPGKKLTANSRTRT